MRELRQELKVAEETHTYVGGRDPWAPSIREHPCARKIEFGPEKPEPPRDVKNRTHLAVPTLAKVSLTPGAAAL